MANVNDQLNTHVLKKVAAANFTIASNGTGTFGVGASLTTPELEELLRVAGLSNYDLKLVAGVLTLQRR